MGGMCLATMVNGTEWTKRTMVGLTILWVVCVVAAVPVALFSMFMFDAPGSDKNPLTIALAASLWSFPVLAAASPLASWIARVAGAARVSKLLMAAPALSIVAVIASWVALELLCGGSFACHSRW